MKKHFAVLVLGSLVFVTGCGPPEAEVSGMVRMDGQPLKEGDIIFEEADKSLTPAGGKIVDGMYTVKMLPGAKTVRITASRPTAKPDPVMGSAARESMIPAEFNDRTTLKADIQAGKREGLDFDVKSIPQ